MSQTLRVLKTLRVSMASRRRCISQRVYTGHKIQAFEILIGANQSRKTVILHSGSVDSISWFQPHDVMGIEQINCQTNVGLRHRQNDEGVFQNVTAELHTLISQFDVAVAIEQLLKDFGMMAATKAPVSTSDKIRIQGSL